MDYVYTISSDGELCHWGIKGMKWGQRRYQNKDGSLTPAGKKRYAKEEAALKEREKTIKNREREAARRAKMDAKKAELDARENALKGPGKKGKKGKTDPNTPQQKSIKDMTADELRDLTERMNLEKNYYEARNNLAKVNPRQPSPLEKLKDTYLDDIVKSVVIEPAKQYVNKQLGKKLGLDEKDPLGKLETAWKKADYKKKIAEAERDEKKAKNPSEEKPNWESELKRQQYQKNEREEAERKANAERDAEIAAYEAETARIKRETARTQAEIAQRNAERKLQEGEWEDWQKQVEEWEKRQRGGK